jgi:hypothetical protein
MKVFAFLAAAAILVACGPPSADQIQNQKQEQLVQQSVNEVGMPAITHFFEKRQLKTIFELRDRQINTLTYLQDLQGHLHKLCDSIGYGIPYATQYTNPQHFDLPPNNGGNYQSVPQADPNGLYSPSAAAGTWVLCLNPKTKQIAPVYAEPNVVVSQFAMQTE